MDRFVKTILVISDVVDCVLGRSDECSAHNLLKPKYCSLGLR